MILKSSKIYIYKISTNNFEIDTLETGKLYKVLDFAKMSETNSIF